MFGTIVRAVLWSLVLVKGVELVVGGTQAAAAGLRMPGEEEAPVSED